MLRSSFALGPDFETLKSFEELSVVGSLMPDPEYLVVFGDRVHATATNRIPVMPYLYIVADY